MQEKKTYYAFISYSHKDEEWAKWLQHEFEHYHLPTKLNGHPDVPDKFSPVFRDVDELSGGELKPQISYALRQSANLIIICSPNSAKSLYVNDEIREFVDIGKTAGINNVPNIFPFIIEGVPHSEDPWEECFPRALKELPSEHIAGDVTKYGREHAFVKILSGTLRKSNIGFSMLWDRFERDRIETERKKREERDRLLQLESRYLSEKAIDLSCVDSQLAKMLVLRSLPENLAEPDRPYCVEAEDALRKVCHKKSTILRGHESGVLAFCMNPLSTQAVSADMDGSIRVWDLERGVQIGEHIHVHGGPIQDVTYSQDGKHLASCSKDGRLILWDATSMRQMHIVSFQPENHIKRVEFTNDGKCLVGLSADSILLVWDVNDWRLLRKGHVGNSNDMAIDNRDRWVALATLSSSIEIYDLNALEMVGEIHKAHSESLSSIDFNPDGSLLLSASFDGKIKVWNWRNRKIMFASSVGTVWGAYAPVVCSARFSNDGSQIVTSSSDGLIRIWNSKIGEQAYPNFVGHSSMACDARFSRDGRFVVSVSLDSSVRIWDIKSEVPYKVIGRARYIPFDSKPECDNYSLKIDKCSILIADSSDDTKVVMSCLHGHSAMPRKHAFNPEGNLLVTVADNEMKVWDILHNVQIGPDILIFEEFFDVMFTADGKGIIAETKSDYDIMFEWKPLQELIDHVRRQIGERQFTEEEKKRYYLD